MSQLVKIENKMAVIPTFNGVVNDEQVAVNAAAWMASKLGITLTKDGGTLRKQAIEQGKTTEEVLSVRHEFNANKADFNVFSATFGGGLCGNSGFRKAVKQTKSGYVIRCRKINEKVAKGLSLRAENARYRELLVANGIAVS